MGWALCPALSMAGLDKIKKVGQAFVYEVLCPLFFRLLSLDFFFFFVYSLCFRVWLLLWFRCR